jgi:hypothetical protein
MSPLYEMIDLLVDLRKTKTNAELVAGMAAG